MTRMTTEEYEKRREAVYRNFEEYLRLMADDCTIFYRRGGKTTAVEGRLVNWTNRAKQLFMLEDNERCFLIPSLVGPLGQLERGDCVEWNQSLYQIDIALFSEGLFRFMAFAGYAWVYFAFERERKT